MPREKSIQDHSKVTYIVSLQRLRKTDQLQTCYIGDFRLLEGKVGRVDLGDENPSTRPKRSDELTLLGCFSQTKMNLNELIE